MTFGAAPWLHLGWGVLLLLAVIVWASSARRKALQRVVPAALRSRLVPPGLGLLRAWQGTLLLVGLGFGVVAAAQPRWGFQWRDLESRGVEVVVAVDVSRSMDAQDVSPSRMERARREVADLLELLPGDRVALVVFAGGAYPRVPLTLDHDALAGILADTGTGLLQAQGSSLASAVAASVALFDDDRPADRAIFVVSDGEAWDPDLDAAVQTLTESRVKVYALGVGTEQGAPIPNEGGGFKRGRDDQLVVTRLDESGLRRLAAETGGAYVRSVAGAQDVRGLVSELRAATEAEALNVRREKVWEERFQWFLAPGLGLLVLAAALGGLPRTAPLALLVCMSGVARAEDGAGSDVEVRVAAEVDRPDDVEVAWKAAESLHQAGRYEDAADAWARLAAREPSADRAADARYNQGLAQYRGGALEHAVQTWQELVQQHPEHAAARQASEAVGQEIQQRLQPPPPPEEGGEPPPDGADQPQDPGSAQPPPDPGSGDQGDADQDQGERPEGEDPRDLEDLRSGELAEQEQTPTGEEVPPEAPEGVQEMSPDEALRLLESAEEGSPSVVVRGRPQGKDW